MPPTSGDSVLMESLASPPSTSSAPSSSSSQNEAFVLLANGTKGAAAVGLVRQVLEAPGVFVFGELLDHPNIRSLSSSPPSDGPPHLCLLELFAFGTYAQYLSDRVPSSLPELTKQMQKKLRLLTVASMATSSRVLEYSHLREELGLSSVRELEDLIIEGANANVIHGKLDQQSLHFEVDYAMPRDIRKSEVNNVIQTLEDWCTSCDGMLKCLESQAGRANTVKAATLEHKKQIEQKVGEIRGQLKQSQSSSDGCCDDPDSRMDTEGPRREAKKVAGKAKGQRGGDSRKAAGGGGGGGGFWPK